MTIIYPLIIILCIFAVYNEIRQYNDSYILAKPDKESNKTKKNSKANKRYLINTLKKIKICVSYDFKTIKWRRTFLASVSATFLIYFVVNNNFPKEKDFLLTTIVIFLVISLMWYSYINKTAKEVNRFCDQNLLNVLNVINS